jgi:hypothetical protein
MVPNLLFILVKYKCIDFIYILYTLLDPYKN